MLENEEFFQTFTQDALNASMTSELSKMRMEDPESFGAFENNFRKNLRGQLVASAYAGETAKDTLISRTTALRQEPQSLPVDTYKEVVNSNPKAFEKFGIVRDGSLIYGDDTNDGLNFANQVIKNPELHKSIVQERYKQFQNALTKSHNNPALVDDPTKKTQAYVIFDKLGSEGLTQYMNLLQRGDTDADITERYTGFQQAKDFFGRASLDGKNIYDMIDEFVTGGEQPLTFTPVEPRQDMTVKVPEDHNFYTMHYYNVEGDEFTEKDPYDSAIKFLERHVPEKYQEYIDKKELRRDGPFSEGWRHTTYSIYQEAYEGDLYSLRDLMDTVKVHGEHQEKDRYRININEVPLKVQLAIDALRHDDEANYMFQYVSDGVYDFREKRREEAQNLWDKVGSYLFATKDELYRDESGELQSREVVDTGGFTGLYNSIATIGLGVADMAMRFFVEPLTRVTGNLTQHEGTQAFAAKLQDWTGVNMATTMSSDTHGAVPNAIGEVAPFLQYMGSMMIGGSGLIRLGAKGFSAITGAKKAYDVQRYAGHMIGSGRIQAMANKLNHAVKNKTPWARASLTSRSPWVTGAGVFYTGGAVIEATQPKDMSFFNTLPQVFGYEPTNDLTKLYKTASDHNRVAMNIGASLMMDGLFDTVIAGSKFLTAKAGQNYFGRTKFKGITYVGEEAGTTFNGYKVVSEPQFRHDLREFWHNMTTGLDELPIGSVGQSMARNLVKGAPYESLHDFTKGFIDESGYVVQNIKKDIEDNIRVLNQTLGDGVTLEDSAIKTLVDEQYNIFLNSTADQIYGTLRTASDDLPLRFAQTLDEQTPTIKQFKVDGKPVRASQLGEYSGRSDTGKLIAKDGYLYEVDPQYWTIDLADAIRTSALKKQTDDIVQRKVDELGPDKSVEQVQQIEREVKQTVGTPVNVDGKAGYVVDFDDAGYTVRTSDGDVTRTSVLSRLGDEEVEQMVMDATNNPIIRQRLAIGFNAPRSEVPERPRALLGAGRPPVEREADLLRQIDEVDNAINQVEGRINDLSRRYSVLDDIIDDGTQRGVQKRAITKEIKELQVRKEEIIDNKKQSQRQLSEFLRDNPQVQSSRYVDGLADSNKSGIIAGKYQTKVGQVVDSIAQINQKTLRKPFC